MENLEQAPKINFDGSKFVESIRVSDLYSDLYKELGSEARQFTFDIPEVVSNLAKMFYTTFDSWEEIEVAIDDAFSGERSSLSPIKLPQEMKEKFKNLIVEKIKKQIGIP